MKGSNQRLSMEKYIEFVDSRKKIDLKVNFLNQIISMHGFKKICKAPKSELSDAVQALDLKDPSRSTLKENISSCASLSLNDVVADLNDLAWQECCVTSISILKSTNTNTTNITTASTNSDTETSQPSKSLTRDSSASTSPYFGSEIAEMPMKLVPKRKRS